MRETEGEIEREGGRGGGDRGMVERGREGGRGLHTMHVIHMCVYIYV